ncbi:MAG: M48 family metallopeptidase [Hellea sp.]|nr:M48 family metallopeptidase [Hellea sp.]
MKIIKGHIFGAQILGRKPCELLIRHNQVQLNFRDNEHAPEYCCEVEDLDVYPSAEIGEGRIILPDGRTFASDDFDSLERLQSVSFWKRLTQFDRGRNGLLKILILTIALLFIAYKIILPMFVSMGMAATPDSFLHSMDEGILKSLDAEYLDQSDITAAREAEVNQIFNRLVAARKTLERGHLSNREFVYQLKFRSANILGPNAFAMPGGTIIITDELIEDFPDDAVIAAVLAHEIGHVEYRHGLRQIYRNLGFWTLTKIAVGGSGSIFEGALFSGTQLITLSYSRRHELQSDDYSFLLVQEAGFEANGLIEFFENIPKEDFEMKGLNWLSTHPMSSRRIRNIQDKIEALE